MDPSRESDEKYLVKRPAAANKNYVLVIHGGAGTISRDRSTPEQWAAYKAALSQSLQAGYKVLSEGGEAIDAVVAAVSVMEDNPLFNSGKGAVFNVDGKNELETSLMLSKPPASRPDIPASRRGLGLTLLTRAKNPSHFARALYLSPSVAPHTFLSGATAEKIGESLGETLVDPSYFFTEHRWREHRRGLGLPDSDDEEGTSDPFSGSGTKPEFQVGDTYPLPLDQLPQGTVGAVALDVTGCIAALTSTGGKTNKLVGRIGDTPVMGSGFWAEEWSVRDQQKGWVRHVWNKITGKDKGKAAGEKKEGVGISCTGDGDYFIRQATAATIARRVQFLREPLAKAAKNAVDDLYADGGLGGVIALDRKGNVAMPLNCSGMYRGVIREDGVAKVAIFSDEDIAPL